MDEIFIISYLYICVWKTIGRINEDFILHVLMAINIFFGFYMATVLMLSEHHMSFDKYRFCSGNNSISSIYIFSSGLPFIWIALLVSAVLCTLIFARICFVVKRATIQLVASNPTVHQIQGSLYYSFDILRMAQVRIFVAFAALIPNATVALISKADLKNETYSIQIQVARIISSYSIPIMMSFVSPMLLIYYRQPFRSKFLRLFKRGSVQPLYDITAFT